MTAYIIVEAVIHNPEQFGAYAQAVPGIVAEFGGEYLVLGGQQEPLEGEWGHTRLVMHRWPSAEQARAFWSSDAYAAAKPLREGTGEFRVMLVDGLQQTPLE
ncbi:MAG: DUF1330 domain-containing protein [Luminiphilus sp.]|nr:DUF1330 domain-containing protein [Luminiphilus sp.]